jgi:hypothetical protein
MLCMYLLCGSCNFNKLFYSLVYTFKNLFIFLYWRDVFRKTYSQFLN